MTAQDRLKQYFYEHIIKHDDFDISNFEDGNNNVIELPKTFDDLIQMFDDYGVDDWYYDFDIDNLEFEIAENDKGTVVSVYQVEPNVFISLKCIQDYNYKWIYEFDKAQYVKQVEVTRTEWQSYETH
jgi:hypothetical protein